MKKKKRDSEVETADVHSYRSRIECTAYSSYNIQHHTSWVTSLVTATSSCGSLTPKPQQRRALLRTGVRELSLATHRQPVLPVVDNHAAVGEPLQGIPTAVVDVDVHPRATTSLSAKESVPAVRDILDLASRERSSMIQL